MQSAPRPIKLAIYLTGVFVLINLVTMVLILASRNSLQPAIIAQYHLDASDAAKVQTVTNYVQYGGAAVHVLLSVAGVWFAANILKTKAWARRRLTALLIVSGLISFYMFSHLLAGGTEIAVHIISDLVKIAIVALLWLPTESRKYFK